MPSGKAGQKAVIATAREVFTLTQQFRHHAGRRCQIASQAGEYLRLKHGIECADCVPARIIYTVVRSPI